MGFQGLERPFLDLVSQTPRRRGRGRPVFADCREFSRHFGCFVVFRTANLGAPASQWLRIGKFSVLLRA